MQLDDVRMIVTGAAHGIGRGTVAACLREGARVVALDVALPDAEHPVHAIRNAAASARFARCDVTVKDEVDRVFDEAVRTLGGLDVLVHAAGILRLGAAADLTPEACEEVLRVNVMGTILTNQAAFRHMKERGGRIVNFGSGGGVRGQIGSAHYAASKGAVHSWTRTAAQEWGRHKISVNAVAPAAWTKMYDDYLAAMPEGVREIFLAETSKRMPLADRLGDPEKDIAPVVVFLASDAAHFMTGQIVPVDGGMVMLGS
ncbi:MAG: SDR family oxidoreductase [Deltaproteobacteria bacterium]|nr:SDR family oxidoreductase [Deltaproteobacteria bacterium]